MSYPGLLCLLIKSANLQPENPVSVLGSGLAGGLLGGGVGALGGALHGYFNEPEEVDPMTGQPTKTKWDNAWEKAKHYGLIGGGVGGLVGAHTGWNNKTQGWDFGKQMVDKYSPGAWEDYTKNWHAPNLMKTLNENRNAAQ